MMMGRITHMDHAALSIDSAIFSVYAMPFTPGTLNEYDMILAVSQDAINAQFELLFDTPNPKNFDENLIPNSLTLGYKKYDSKTDTWKDSKQGVTADIESVTVDINNISPGETLFRSVRIVVKITDGTLNYWDEEDLSELDVTGYTVSWVAQIGQRNIEDIEEEAMHPNAKKAIQDSLAEVDHEDYLVSSLYCLFESAQVANSFQLLDDTGSQAQDDTQVAAFLNSLIITYTTLDAKQYPYVLGYGVSQKIPKPMTGTPAFFPARFYFSTTPNSDDESQASVNFLIINGDTHDANLVDPTKNPSAGVLSTPFIDVTRASNLQSDGIFAVSDDLFFKHWLRPAILDTFSFSDSLFDDIEMTVTDQLTGGTGTATASKSSEWISEWIETDSLWTGDDRRQYSGYSTINISYTSLLQSQTSGDIAVDANREIALDVVGVVYNKVQFNKYLITGWLDEGYLDSITKWDFSLTISPAEDGKWYVQKTSWNIPGTTTSGNHINVEGYIDALTSFFDLGKLVTFFGELNDISESAFDGVTDALNSISTSIIIPAGDVYTFLGLDSDNAGNLYSHIKYKTILSGQQT